jgi:glutamate/aspartate transport system substrate-binding protein
LESPVDQMIRRAFCLEFSETLIRTMKHRVISFVAVLALVCVPLWSSAADGPSISRIRDTGVIVIGYRPASLPFSYLDANLKPIGYSIELCDRVVAAVKRKLKLPELEVKRVAVSSATRMPMVANGMLDMECGITTNTAERARNQSFSITTFVTETKLLTRSVDKVESLDDLRGKPVASTIGTTSIQYLHALNAQQGMGFRILAGLDDPEAFHLLRIGRARAFMMDDVLIRSMLAQLPSPRGYEISDQALTVEPYGIGLSREDPGFKQLVDEVLTGLYRSGEIFAIYKRWFESPIPPNGINLNLPMSESFKRVIAQPTDTPDPAHYR